MFDSLSGRFEGIFGRLREKGRLGQEDVEATLRDVRMALLEADVNVAVVKSLLARIGERAVGAELIKSLSPAQLVIKVVHEELVRTLGDAASDLVRPSRPPMVVMVVGLQGSGKTTTAAKLAQRLQQTGTRPLLVAADLQRPAAIEQLEVLGRQIGVSVFREPSSGPIRLVKEALREAGRGGFGAVVIDTAGRLQIDVGLMSELADLRNVAAPHEVLLVVDAMTGQDAVNVALGFTERSKVTGFVLSKVDSDARGGAAISIREVTGLPIKFFGTGERLSDLEVFHPERIASRILGMGDVLTLIEKAEEAYDKAEADEMAAKIRSAAFTLEDFLAQFQQVRKMGPLTDLLAMLPGAGAALRGVELADRDLQRVEGIIRSMTPGERRDPRIIDGSRRRRIAVGSGVTPQAVNNLLRQFTQTQQMMKSLAEGRVMPGLPGVLSGTRPGRNRRQRKR